MMRIWDEPGHGTEDGEGLDLEMGGPLINIRLIERNVRVVLLVDVEVFDQAFLEEVVETHTSTP